MSAYLCEHAWLGGPTAQDDVLVEVDGGRVSAVTPGFEGSAPRGVVRLSGLTVPGLANVHSHAFHRAVQSLPYQPPARARPDVGRELPSIAPIAP